MKNLNEFTTTILIHKIKIFLFSVGLNEKYIAFEYLSLIIIQLITKNSSTTSYNQAIKLVSNRHNISERTTTQAINKILKQIKDENISKLTTLNLTKNKTLNTIRVLTHNFEKSLMLI